MNTSPAERVTPLDRVAGRVRAALAEAMVRNVDLVKLLDLDEPSISRRKSGKTRWSYAQLDRIAQRLGLTIEQLTGVPANELIASYLNVSVERLASGEGEITGPSSPLADRLSRLKSANVRPGATHPFERPGTVPVRASLTRPARVQRVAAA